ncbi:hypothetical protein DSO57_1015677 [Entomophthora muscae]|uniref:Uncharacterized protein n=1 Tax=Entomophthora muscae TaxID=34485 RepID=A0ACC2UQF9_9FUNG|nr:hypothetical protein DSO57_1015677 [Entomophthora muscae]
MEEIDDLATSWNQAAPEEEFNLYRAVNIWMSSMSITLAMLVFVVAVLICQFGTAARRVSFRMVMVLTLSDAGLAAAQLVSIFQDEGVMCTISTYCFILFTLLSQFLTLCIALHLHMVVVLRLSLPRWIEAAYFGVSFGMATVIATVPVLFGRIGFDSEANSCWFINEKDPMTLVWQMGTLYSWSFVSIVYCTLVFLLLMCTILSNDLRPSAMPSSQVRRIIIRVAMYPLVPLLTMSANFLATVQVAVTGEGDYTLSFAAMALLSSRGCINAFIFCFDPVVRTAAQSARITIVRSHFPALSPTPINPSTSKVGHFFTKHLLLNRRERHILDYSQLVDKSLSPTVSGGWLDTI